MNTHIKLLLYLIFILSGFTGLIYESIWTHYLKLLLGHASYAQTLVLALFMGGMAIGAWLASRFSMQWKNPLLLYAIVEAVIGLLALSFHTVFVFVSNYLHTTVFIAISPDWVQVSKWLIASLLILPQSVLLGLTFPLMSSGIIRLSTQQSGSTIAILYFNNSIGAACGAIISSFVMIAQVGLPGTIKIAGLLNILLAIIVLILENITSFEKPYSTSHYSPNKISFWTKSGLILAAAITGIASFFYEIAWIRMLSMVLGSSVHSFELMLSVFITGLALGGLWIRSRIDLLKIPILWFAIIQIIMGLFALLTIPLYNFTFDFMAFLIHALKPNADGYSLFNIGGHAIAMCIMLPTTFMAGMTLPLLTQTLFTQGIGEKSIGQIYTANTLGAIIGIIFAVHIIIPLTNLRTLILVGVMLDCAVGLTVLYFITISAYKTRAILVGAFVMCSILYIAQFSHFDPYRMASSVYRFGSAKITDAQVIHHDGKTASIDIIQFPSGSKAIATNGKVDARINPPLIEPSIDESTMVLLGALPLGFFPDAQQVANIGLGSGMTSHTVLGSDLLKSIDTIEIEQAVVDMAKHFGPQTERVYNDPRSQIYIEDAKTFFSRQQKVYDIIISEPSNPWVSGVANLFTKEFYHHTKQYLNQDGLFVQWIHLYENNEYLLSSIFKAINQEFNYYKIYNSNNNDIIVIASQTNHYIKELKSSIFSNQQLSQSLNRINISNASELSMHYIGDQVLFNAFSKAYTSPINSDYYPYLAYNAPKARFLNQSANSLTGLHLLPIPLLTLLGYYDISVFPKENIHFAMNTSQKLAFGVKKLLLFQPTDEEKMDVNVKNSIYATRYHCKKIPDKMLVANFLIIANHTNSYLPETDTVEIWQSIGSNCIDNDSSPVIVEWYNLHYGIAQRNYLQIAKATENIISTQKTFNNEEIDYLISSGVTGYYMENKLEEAQILWRKLLGDRNSDQLPIHLNILKELIHLQPKNLSP